jgi:von Willebrand factor type A domain
VDITFLTPFAGLLAVGAAVPLSVHLARQRRLSRVRGALGLAEPAIGSRLPLVLALAAVPALLGIAAAQPVVETTRVVPERTDVQAFAVLDVSRSMLASAAPGEPTRFDRAQRLAMELRDALPEVPFGVASLTDRVLPHLFPTTDTRVFAATVDDALAVEHPPPGAFYLTAATSLDALASVPTLNYFPPAAKKRVLVVLTDGETSPLEGRLPPAFERTPRVQVVFVRFWDADERIYETGVAEGGYEPDTRSSTLLEEVAAQVRGRVFSEHDAPQAVDAVREAIGSGSTVDVPHEAGRRPLMPWIALASLVPLAFVLVRRNVWWQRRLTSRPEAEARPGGAKVSEPRGVAQPG